MSGAAPLASVVIRNRDEGEYLRAVLAALRAQDEGPLDIVVVDNASGDDSVAIAAAAGARVVPLARDAFTYGRALNLGLAHARAEVCIVLSAHALPLGPAFVRECVRPFADPTIAAARCVYAGKRGDELRWATPLVLDAACDLATIVRHGPLASGCVVRRSVWAGIPFDEDVAAVEDKLWAARVLAAGHRVLSPCAAFYAYVKPQSGAPLVRKSWRELAALAAAGGPRLGRAAEGRAHALGAFLRTSLLAAPKAGLRLAHEEWVHLVERWRFERRVADFRSRPPGS